MAKPTGQLVRFPILDSLGNEVNFAPSQRVVTQGLNGKMGINDAYTKAETTKLINDQVVQSKGTATNKVMSQKVVTDELNIRYTKTESDNRYYQKNEVNNIVNEAVNKSQTKFMSAVGNMDGPVEGVFIGNWNDASGTKPGLPGVGMLSSYCTPNYKSGSNDLTNVFQRAEAAPTAGNNLSGEIMWRYFTYNRTTKAITNNTGWSKPRYRWSKD